MADCHDDAVRVLGSDSWPSHRGAVLPRPSAARISRAASTRRSAASTPGEAVAVIHASCERCDWGVEGREAAAVRISSTASIRSTCCSRAARTTPTTTSRSGAVAAGDAPAADRAGRGAVGGAGGRRRVSQVDIVVITPAGDDFVAQSMAPILYARPNTVGKFTDVPVFMWYEIVPVPRGPAVPLLGDLHERGRRHRDRPADGDLGPDDRRGVRLRRDGDAQGRSSPRSSRARITKCPPSAAGMKARIRCSGCPPTTTW